MAAGLRVIRGPDWNLGDLDGGEGHVGTVEQVKDNSVAKIIWDGGQLSECRVSAGNGHDLRVLDNATVGIRHPRVVCDACCESGIVGMRWKCAECDDYDLCSPCYFRDEHDCNHQFYRIETPYSTEEKQEKRSKSMKMRVLGIFPDATVVRGKDWEWKDQDGGQGKTGTVMELLTPATHSARSTVKVQWESGQSNVYRLGYKGKVDLQYTEEAPGIECYPQHLPPFDADNYKEEKLQGGRPSENIVEGDSVIIAVGPEQLQELQKARSGWAAGMTQCIGKVGKVQGFAANGDAIVSFGNKKYRLNPAGLKKVSSMEVGGHVRILDDEEKVKMLQDGHGGYNDRMRTCLGKVGKVEKIDADGDVVVKFGDRHWVFAPACCVSAPGAEVDFISSQSDGGDALKIMLGGNDQGRDLMSLLTVLAQVTGQPMEGLFLKAIAEREEDRALDMLRKKPTLAKSGTTNLTALHIAANRGLLRITTALVGAGADLNIKDKDGDTPLMAALAGGCDEVSVCLIKKGCDVNIHNNGGQTASHKAAISGFPNVLRELKARNADFNAQDETGDTPLHDCITKGKVDAAEIILSWPRLDLRRPNKKGHPPLHYACMKDEASIVDWIIRKDRSLVNAQKNDGWTPLHVCACNDHVQSMKILLDKGNATVNIGNKEKQSPLHVAAHEAALECVQVLVQHGADVNSRDAMGNTPLHVTLAGLAMGGDEMGLLLMLLGQSGKGREQVRIRQACFLVQNGADPQARNNDGIPALDACPSTHSHVKEAVKRFIAENRSTIEAGRTAAARGGAQPQPEDASCTDCKVRKAQVLMVPCGHRVLCRECIAGVSRCPLCRTPAKQMFDKDGKKINNGQCAVM